MSASSSPPAAPSAPPAKLTTPTILTFARTLTAAEAEWLQEEDIHSAPAPPADVSETGRFDWRQRASSRRTRPPDKLPNGRKKYVKRKAPPYNVLQPGEPFFDEVRAYQNKFLPLLDAEQTEDEAELRERLSNWSLSRLKEEGYCLTGLSAYWLQANQFGRPVASFLLGPGLALPENRFENGSQVLVSRLDPMREPPRKGSVVARSTSQIKISFTEQFDLDGIHRLDLGLSSIVYERMRTAIMYLHQDPVALEGAPASDDRELILHGTHLRGALLRAFAPPDTPLPPASPPAGAFAADMRIQSWARRYARTDPVRVEGDPVLDGLNATQVRAVAMMVSEPVSLVQGPPGTGKTKTIIETVKLLKVHFEVPHPLLVCTYTNVAVDNLVEGLVAAGVKPLRVGHGSKVKAALVPYTLDDKLDKHEMRPELDQLVAEDEELQRALHDLEANIEATQKKSRVEARLENMRRQHARLQRLQTVQQARIFGLKQEMLRDIVARADVICTTCITSASVALNIMDFPVVFLDEASMSTEPASLIPIVKGSRHIALIGDHKQLPPIITSSEAQASGLGVSLFERLTEEGVVPSIMLDVQYRMHPAISRFPSSEFYEHTLQDGTVDAGGNIAPHLMPPRSRHLQAHVETGKRPSVIFLDHVGSESMKDRSRVNLHEAHIVCSVVEDLLLNNERLEGKDIGIIAPYAAQIALLTRLFNTDAKYRERFRLVLGDLRAMQLGHIEIRTVDGFEGREKEVIVFSTVRNNAGGYIGFLADQRRLNVGLTRAKRGLFVVGSMSTLASGQGTARAAGTAGAERSGKGAASWQRYAKYLADEGLVVQLRGAALGTALYGNVEARRAAM